MQEKIAVSAKKSGRTANDVQLVAVSKRFSSDFIQIAYDCGLRVFGENRVQEAVEKATYFADMADLEFHFIGNIQKNKVKHLGQSFSLIHSIDSIELVNTMEKRFEHEQPVLIQVNIAGEAQKSGVALDEVEMLIDHVIGSKHLILKGLMLIPPNFDNREDTRNVFKRMKTLFDELKNKYGQGENYSFDILSMGMSGDFEIAIEEGSNMVRVGSAIFGQRPVT